MKMKLWEKVETEVEVDVEFPIYHRHNLDSDYSSSTIFMRVDKVGNKLWEWYIHIHDSGEIELGIRKNYIFDRSSPDYLLGKGEYESNEREFMEALRKAEKFLKAAKEFVEGEQPCG